MSQGRPFQRQKEGKWRIEKEKIYESNQYNI